VASQIRIAHAEIADIGYGIPCRCLPVDLLERKAAKADAV